jgi:ABC-type multidrug transport system fused ATPase/permease subunit
VEECHDHQIFYRLSTLYDIILLVLPTIVIVTIALYDLNEADHISVEQVYVLLSLLGICYNPMKAFRTLTISFHDGAWSLNKIQDYLNSPDEEENETLRMSRGF